MVKEQVVGDDGGSNLGKTGMLEFAFKIIINIVKRKKEKKKASKTSTINAMWILIQNPGNKPNYPSI